MPQIDEPLTNSQSCTWVVIPSYNEDPLSLEEVLTGLSGRGYKIVIVDDGSEKPVTPHKSTHHLRHLINLGQGAALQTGISYALKQGGQYFVTFDADGQHQADEIGFLLGPLLKDEADVALGSRFLKPGRTQGISLAKIVLLKLATAYTRASTGLALTDTHNGLRAFNTKAAQQIQITQNRMSHASQILSQISELKLRYVEIPVTISYTAYSRAKGQKMTNSINILWESLWGSLLK